MKKIKLKIVNSFGEREGSLPTGAVLDVPELTARVWINQGFAIELEQPKPKRERASRKAFEKATLTA